MSNVFQRNFSYLTTGKPNMSWVFQNQIFNHAAIGLGVVSLDGKWLKVNTRLTDILGYGEDEFVTMSNTQLIYKLDIPIDQIQIQLLKAGKIKSFSVDKRFIHKNGHLIWVKLNVALVRDSFGDPDYFIAAVDDISLYKEIEAERRRLFLKEKSAFADAEAARAELSAMVESISDAFFVVDNKWRFSYVNPAVVEIWKKSRLELLGKCIWTCFPEAVNGIKYAKLKIAMNKRQPVRFEVLSAIIHRWIDVTAYPSGNGGLSVYFRDISQRKMLDEQKDEFIGVASHELKTPVTSLKLYTQALQKLCATPNTIAPSGLLAKMNQQIDKLTDLINHLLDVTQIQRGKMKFTNKRILFDQLIDEKIAEVRITTDLHKIEKSGLTGVYIEGDEERLGQVLLNLLANAVKYSPDGGDIQVKVEEFNDTLKVSVRDSGIGIPKEFAAKIFARFYRISEDINTRYKKIPGLGLGLYISAEIIKRHGGSIWVDNSTDKGSTICFTLPKKGYYTSKG